MVGTGVFGDLLLAFKKYGDHFSGNCTGVWAKGERYTFQKVRRTGPELPEDP